MSREESNGFSNGFSADRLVLAADALMAARRMRAAVGRSGPMAGDPLGVAAHGSETAFTPAELGEADAFLRRLGF